MDSDHEEYLGSFFTHAGIAEMAGPGLGQGNSNCASPLAEDIGVRQQVHSGKAAILHMKSMAVLREELLARVHAQSFQFFEKLVIDLLLAMGYAGGRREGIRHIGQSHDNGIDAVIQQDALGLDLILLQAKRLKPGTAVSSPQIREFVGSMEAWHSRRGLFFTTGHFSSHTEKFLHTVPHRIVLVDGPELADLMIKHNIGTQEDARFVFRQVRETYFNGESELK